MYKFLFGLLAFSMIGAYGMDTVLTREAIIDSGQAYFKRVLESRSSGLDADQKNVLAGLMNTIKKNEETLLKLTKNLTNETTTSINLLDKPNQAQQLKMNQSSNKIRLEQSNKIIEILSINQTLCLEIENLNFDVMQKIEGAQILKDFFDNPKALSENEKMYFQSALINPLGQKWLEDVAKEKNTTQEGIISKLFEEDQAEPQEQQKKEPTDFQVDVIGKALNSKCKPEDYVEFLKKKGKTVPTHQEDDKTFIFLNSDDYLSYCIENIEIAFPKMEPKLLLDYQKVLEEVRKGKNFLEAVGKMMWDSQMVNTGNVEKDNLNIIFK